MGQPPAMPYSFEDANLGVPDEAQVHAAVLAMVKTGELVLCDDPKSRCSPIDLMNAVLSSTTPEGVPSPKPFAIWCVHCLPSHIQLTIPCATNAVVHLAALAGFWNSNLSPNSSLAQLLHTQTVSTLSQVADDSELSFKPCTIKTHAAKSFRIKFVKVDDTKQDETSAKLLQIELSHELEKRIRNLTLHTVRTAVAACLPLEGNLLSLQDVRLHIRNNTLKVASSRNKHVHMSMPNPNPTL